MQVLKSRNGLTVLFKPVPGKLVNIKYFVRCGAVNEVRPEDNGLAHALEHMLFAGTLKHSWDDIVSGYRLCGAESNAETSFEYTSYYATCPVQSFETSFALTADLFYNATLPEERWEEVEKKAIISEILTAWDDPTWVLQEKTRRHALGPAYHSSIGSIREIRKARIDRLHRMREEYYKGRNVVVTIAGDLSPGQVLKIVNKYDCWSPEPPLKSDHIKVGWNSKKFSQKKLGLNQSLLFVSKPLSKPKTNKDFFRQRLLLEIFQEYLHCELREINGLCYAVEASIFDNLRQRDYLEIFTSGEPDSSPQLLSALERAIERFPSEGIDKITLEQARMSGLREILQAEASVSSVTEVLGRHWLEGKRGDPFTAMHRGLESVSVAGLRKLAAEQFVGKYKVGSCKP